AALFAGVVPTSTPTPGPSESATELSRAGYSLATLSELAEQGASTAELRAAAVDLNAELAELVAGADGDPLAARQALLLVQASTQVLAEQADGGLLSEVLARTRELERALRDVLPVPAAPLPAAPPLPIEAVVRPSPTGQPTRPAADPSSSPAPSRTAPASPRPSSTEPSSAQPSSARPSSAPPASTPSPAASSVNPFASAPALGG
ncbi:MAG: hypothetical protein JWN08_2458, partial [Frankiales bacterium]|nr:hypothetical protein [Frankiales bacterium]